MSWERIETCLMKKIRKLVMPLILWTKVVAVSVGQDSVGASLRLSLHEWRGKWGEGVRLHVRTVHSAVLGISLLWWNTTTKIILGRRRFIASYSSRSIIQGSQDRNQGRIPEAVIDRGMLLTCLLIMAFSASFLIPSSVLPIQKWHHPCGTVPGTSIISQENEPQAFPRANMVGAFSQLRSSLPKWL